jgi:hypothetical protein
MKIKNILQEMGKNILSVLVGGILGTVISVWYGLHFWLPGRIASLDSGFSILFGTLAFIAVTILLFGILGMILGAVWGIIIFQTVKLIGKLKKKRK